MKGENLTSRVVHLSDSEMDGVILELAGVDAIAHLLDCPQCQANVTRFQQSTALFNQATFGWAEAKSNTLPLIELPRRGSPGIRAFAFPATAALGVVVALLLFSHRAPETPKFAVNPVHAGAASIDLDAAQLARDNELLEAINTEMEPAEPPLSAFLAVSPEDLDPAGRGVRN